MRIDRVGMEQVVLHPADDATEGRYVATQDPVGIHPAQFVGDAVRCAQDLDEEAMVARILAELLVD